MLLLHSIPRWSSHPRANTRSYISPIASSLGQRNTCFDQSTPGLWLIMARAVKREAYSPLEWNAEVLEVDDETPSVKTFRFSRPKTLFSFRPGQYMVVKLTDVTDPRGDSRTFSISSSPTDEDAVSVTTRLGPSPFKQRLFGIRPGEPVNLWAPFGSFVLEDAHPAVLLGGGIGVTPFRSMIRFAVARKLRSPVVLLYSSRISEEIVYRNEFETLHGNGQTSSPRYA
jgi:ferredoxin-NADP reductase